MADLDFVGRKRHPVKIALYSILTLGIYGRVFVFKTLKEIDGHQVLFLNHNAYRFLLILPIIGPYIAKWRLAGLLPELGRHDVTGEPVSTAGLRWAALVPLFPLFHLLVQAHLTPHWELHRKLSDLAAKREVLETLSKSRRKADEERASELAAEIKTLERELEDAQETALALRAAEEAKRQAEEEIRRVGGRVGLLRRLGVARRRPKASAGGAEQPEREAPEEPAPEARRRLPFRKRKEAEAEAPAADAHEPALEPAPEPEPPRRRLGFFARGAEGTGPETPPAVEGDEPAAPAEPSRKERRAQAKAEKQRRREEKKAAKLAAKEEKRRAKEEARERKREAKDEAAGKAEEAAVSEPSEPGGETAVPEAVPEAAPAEAVPKPARRRAAAKGKKGRGA